MDSPQTLQRDCLVNLHPQPPASPTWPVSSSVSRLDSPWFAVWGRPPITTVMSGHTRVPGPPGHWFRSLRLGSMACCSQQRTLSSEELMSRNVWASEEEAESTNRFCGHIKKLFAAPPWAPLSLGPKVTRVFDCTLLVSWENDWGRRPHIETVLL